MGHAKTNDGQKRRIRKYVERLYNSPSALGWPMFPDFIIAMVDIMLQTYKLHMARNRTGYRGPPQLHAFSELLQLGYNSIRPLAPLSAGCAAWVDMQHIFLVRTARATSAARRRRFPFLSNPPSSSSSVAAAIHLLTEGGRDRRSALWNSGLRASERASRQRIPKTAAQGRPP